MHLRNSAWDWVQYCDAYDSYYLQSVFTILQIWVFSCSGRYFSNRENSANSTITVCPSAWNSAPTGPIFMKFDFFFLNLEKIYFSFKSNKNASTLHATICIYYHISILLRMRTFSDKICIEKHTFCVQQYFFFFSKIVPFMIMWENTVQPDRLQMAIRQMHIACWMPKGKYSQNK